VAPPDVTRPAKTEHSSRTTLRWLRGQPPALATLVLVGGVGACTLSYNAYLPLIAQSRGGATTYGWLTAAVGVGALAGVVVSAAARRPGPAVVATSCFGTGVCLVLLDSRLPLGVDFVACAGVGVTMTMTISIGLSNAIFQLAAPPQMQGRIMAVFTSSSPEPLPSARFRSALSPTDLRSIPLCFPQAVCCSPSPWPWWPPGRHGGTRDRRRT